MQIQLETNYIPLIRAFDDLPDGVSKKIISTIEQRDSYMDPLAAAIFTFANGVAASLFASWIYNKLKGHPGTKIKINRKEVSINEANIVKIIMEEIEIEK